MKNSEALEYGNTVMYKEPRFLNVCMEQSHLIDMGCGTNKKETFICHVPETSGLLGQAVSSPNPRIFLPCGRHDSNIFQ